ncbi:hypothetical protein PMAYCL1PPCAC_20285, partial [Pristionchus mayeri]
VPDYLSVESSSQNKYDALNTDICIYAILTRDCEQVLEFSVCLWILFSHSQLVSTCLLKNERPQRQTFSLSNRMDQRESFFSEIGLISVTS